MYSSSSATLVEILADPAVAIDGVDVLRIDQLRGTELHAGVEKILTLRGLHAVGDQPLRKARIESPHYICYIVIAVFEARIAAMITAMLRAIVSTEISESWSFLIWHRHTAEDVAHAGPFPDRRLKLVEDEAAGLRPQIRWRFFPLC